MKNFIKIISVVLMLSLCFTVLSAFAPAGTAGETYESDEIVDKLLEDKESSGEKHVGRLKEAESDLYTFVYKNDDGTNTMEVFDHPVKYIDGDGATRDISLSLKKDQSGYAPVAHEIATAFPEELGNGIALSKDDVSLTLIPKDSANTTKAVISGDQKSVAYPLDEKTSYEYSLTYTGFKEDIVVEEYNGRTEYEFTLMTGGLTLREEDGSYTLVNDSGEIKAIVGDIIVFTADERNNCLGTLTHQTVRENQEYRLTIHLEDEYLRDEKTVYPIRIDPTIELHNGSGDIIDVTVNSATASNGTSSSLYVGKRATYGKSRVLMRFPNLDLSNIVCADNIISATVSLRDLLCESESMQVNCYAFSLSGFTETGGSWDTLFPEAYGSLLNSKVVSYANGKSRDHTYPFVITNEVKRWKLSGKSTNNALEFKADDSVENASTYLNKTFGSYNGTSLYRPTLKITYASGLNTSVYYSLYTPIKYNDAKAVNVGWSVSYAQFRMNCYGYAMGFILDGDAVVGYDNGYYGYMQQPGEFANSDDRDAGKVLRNIVYGSPKDSITNIISNMKLDARRWGYTVTSYFPSSSSPVKQFGNDSRLIAVVTGVDDFHFYRQENDGTWSHKPGSGMVTNLSLSDYSTKLTNSNIKSLANSGNYSGGELRFLRVTKSAAVDFPHTARCCNVPCNDTTGDHKATRLYKNDMAGDNILASKTVPSTIVNGKLDYAEDYDWFRYATASDKNYSEVFLSTKSSTMVLKIYNSSGALIKTINGKQSGVGLQMTGQQTYYFCVYSTSHDIQSYILIFS